MTWISCTAFCSLCRAVLATFFVMNTASPETQSKRQLLVILLDGTRWDYVDLMPEVDLGGFKILKEQGVRAEYMEPVTPAMSFPNWRTLSTGLFPESHDVLDNTVYDRTTGAEFSYKSSAAEVLAAAPWWQEMEPVWTTAMLQNKRVATIGWEHSDVPIHNILPEVAEGYPGQHKYNFAARVDKALGHLQLGVDLVMMHFDVIDTMGHKHGPASPQVMDAMRDVGAGLHRLFQSIAYLPHVHVIVVSDHGMTPACNVPRIHLQDYVDIENDTEKVIHSPGVISIYAREGLTWPLYRQLQAVPGWDVRLREHIPDEFHLKNSRFAPDLLLFGHPPEEDYSEESSGLEGGNHGPVPALFPDMRGIFFAWGETFVGGGKVLPPIRAVDVYQIYCHILGIEPRPHNGSKEAVIGMLNINDRNSFGTADVRQSGGPELQPIGFHDGDGGGAGSLTSGGGTGGILTSSRPRLGVHLAPTWGQIGKCPVVAAPCRPAGPYRCPAAHGDQFLDAKWRKILSSSVLSFFILFGFQFVHFM